MGERQTGGGDSAGIELINLLLFCDIDDGKQIASDTHVCRIGHIERRRGRDSGINSIASLLENPQPRLRRERLHCCHNAVPRHHFGSALLQPPLRSIASNPLARRRCRFLRADLHGGTLRQSEARTQDERAKQKIGESVPPFHVAILHTCEVKSSLCRSAYLALSKRDGIPMPIAA